MYNQYFLRSLLFISVTLMLISCTAGDTQFTADTPAGFWYGLWHGAIAIITLIIHVFNDSVLVYESNNTGGWYDLGFLLGVIFVWGGGCHIKCKTRERKKRDAEWEEIGDKVELKVMRKLKGWAEDESAEYESMGDDDKQAGVGDKEDWDELWPKVEKKLKRKIREWAEKD